ncbi:hypothetical protein OS493_021319 [Desmophyllum pertusum]|uniref:G-protein coupled receptors family 1 profile domain-containing protein n=1 Tax=Desmophyllum pertusum TaxID=174260 RepID=A0A9W9ZBM0_9CNID|nr:hypothetical protein OS493_021319 [Desmophyllum pertusum]
MRTTRMTDEGTASDSETEGDRPWKKLRLEVIEDLSSKYDKRVERYQDEAVAEFINALYIPFIVVYDDKGSWILGKATCILVNPLLALTMCVITNSLAIIAVYHYRVMANKARPTGVIISGVWIMALAITLPLFITRKLVQRSTGHFRTCKSSKSDFPGDMNTASANYNNYTIVRQIFTCAVPTLLSCQPT